MLVVYQQLTNISSLIYLLEFQVLYKRLTSCW